MPQLPSRVPGRPDPSGLSRRSSQRLEEFRQDSKVLMIRSVQFVIVMIVMMFATVLVRAGMNLAANAVVVGIPTLILAVYRDPLLIPAFLIALFICWVSPWEDYVQDGDDPRPRRGSRLRRMGTRFVDDDE